jgi:hypothetical protein
MSALEQEHLRVILLDRRNRVLAIVEVYKGSVNSSQVRVGELFKEAIRANASAIIVTHNHPSGCAKKHVGRKFRAEPCTECAEWLEGQGRRPEAESLLKLPRQCGKGSPTLPEAASQTIATVTKEMVV